MKLHDIFRRTINQNDRYGQDFSGVVARAERFPGHALLVGFGPFFFGGNASGQRLWISRLRGGRLRGQSGHGLLFRGLTECANPRIWLAAFLFFYPPLSWMLGRPWVFCGSRGIRCRSFHRLVQTWQDFCSYCAGAKLLPKALRFLARLVTRRIPMRWSISFYMRRRFCGATAWRAGAVAVVLTTRQLCGVVGIAGGCGRGRWVVPRWFSAGGVAYRTHLLSVVAATAWRAHFCWPCSRKRHCGRPLWRGAGGLSLGFGLTAGFYLLPAA